MLGEKDLLMDTCVSWLYAVKPGRLFAWELSYNPENDWQILNIMR